MGCGGGCQGWAREYYLKHDFVALPLQSERLFLAMGTIERIFGGLRAQDEDTVLCQPGNAAYHYRVCFSEVSEK